MLSPLLRQGGTVKQKVGVIMLNKLNKLIKSSLAVTLSLLICLAFAGCNKEDKTDEGTALISSNADPADGYTVTTDETGGTQIIDPDGNVIADTSKGDDITLADDGTLIVTDKDGNTTIINNDGSTVTTTSSGVSATSSKSTSTSLSASGGSSVTEATASSSKEVTDSATRISLKGSSAEITGNGAKVSGNDIIITSAGTYAVSGTLNNGRIVVNASGKKVKVILNGADITCNYSSSFYVYKGGTVTLTAYEGSVNILTDAAEYDYSDGYSSSANEEPDAAVYSADDLILNGSGKLIVNGRFKNGVTGKDALTVEKIDLTVTAAGNGVTGRDSADFKNAVLKVTAGGDAIRSNNAANTSVGTVTLEGCTMELKAGEDGVQAESTLTVKSGTYTVNAGGGSSKTPSSTTSTKGLKGSKKVVISGGACSIDSSDDSIHSNGDIEITNGNLVLSSGDDGIHADETITLSGGTTVVSKSYEGLEATNVTLSGGNLKLVSSDDGLNICGGDGSGNMGRPGMDSFGSSSGGTLKISGGTVWINADGDGLDANGSVEMNGGTVMIDGPTNSGNGALDYDNSFNISGGLLVAVGTSGMAQSPSTSSTQNTLTFVLDSYMSAGTLFHVENSSGKEIITYSPAKKYNWICISSPDIKTGESYTGYYGGSHSGTLSGGIYTSGSYTKGTKLTTLTVSSTITSNGQIGGMGGGMGGGKGGHGGFMW